MTDAARRFGLAYLVLWCQLLLGAAGLVEIVRLFPEQLAFVIGLVLTDGQNAPERVLLLLHLAGYAALGATLWLWQRGDPRTWLMMRIAAFWQLLLAPTGIPVAALLWWMARHPERHEASEAMPIIAGNRRAVVLLIWIGANAAAFLAAVGAFLLLGTPLLWFPAMVAASLPMWVATYVLAVQRADPRETAMPRLPDPVQ